MITRLSLACGSVLIAGAVWAQSDRIAEDRRNLAALSAKQDAVAALVGENRGELSRLLGALQLFGRDPPPALLVSPADATDAVRGAILIGAIAPELEARAKRLTEQARGLAQVRRQVAAAEGELFAAESAVGEDAAGPASAHDTEMTPPAARGAGTALAAGPAPTRLLPPASGTVVSRFGDRLPGGQRSRGDVVRTASGAVVESPADVLVQYAGPLPGWGQIVILGAGGGYHIVLAGLGRILVVPGQRIAKSQTLGLMPSEAAGAKLYFELRSGETPIDPAPLTAQAKDVGLRRKLL